MTTTINRSPRFQRSIDTQILMDRLAQAAIGELVEYDDLSKLIQRDVRESGYGSLMSARRALEAESSIVFEVVVSKGLTRMDDSGKVNSAKAKVNGICRAARRVKRRLGAVDVSKLDSPGRLLFNATATIAGVLDVMSSRSGQRRIEAKVAVTQDKLPLAATLSEFL